MTSPVMDRRRPDPRLPAYLVSGFAFLVLAVATGRAELAALGAPLLVLAALGTAGGPPGRIDGTVTLDEARVIEGDAVEGAVRLEWDGEAEVEAVLTAWRGVSPLEPDPVPGWAPTRRTGPITLRFRLRAESWGHHELGYLWVRIRRPGGLLEREVRLTPAPAVRVLPAPLRLDRLLAPRDPRTVSGLHLSRLRGHGTDFAELRPYRPGDRLRDVSWATSARLGEPWVSVHHPERTGTVLLLLDTFFGEERNTDESLARAARAAWAVASAHLRAQDRVGLLARGRTAAWMPPTGGRRAGWMLVEQLLAVGGAAQDPWRRRRGPRVVVPADALVVGVTALRSRPYLQELLHHRRNGHATVALVVDTSDLLPGGDAPADHSARRLWLARREVERQRLERGGVPTVLVSPGAGVGPAVSTLRRRLRSGRGVGAPAS